jgi:T5SS/PEP-CTERM-associated repeat protein
MLTRNCGAVLAAMWLAAGAGVYGEMGITNTIDGTTINAANYFIGSNGAFNTLIVTNAGALRTTTLGVIGNTDISSNNMALVSGSGSSWSNVGAYLYVGRTGSFNQLTVNQSGRVVTTGGYVGYNALSSNNTVFVSDSGLLQQSYGSEFYLGYAGFGNQLILTNGGVANSYDTYIGNQATANNNLVLISGSGSVWSNTSKLYIGNAGSFNRLTINQGGTFVEQTHSYLGATASSSNNVLWIDGPGSVWSNTSYNWLYVGNAGSGNQLIVTNGGSGFGYYTALGYGSSSSNNLMVVSGSNSCWRNSADIEVGDAGSGNRLIITDGGCVQTRYNTILGYSAGSSNNFVLVSGAGSVLSNGSSVYIGSGASNNKLITTNGGVIVGGVGVYGTNNMAVLTGTGSIWTNSSVTINGNGNSLIIANGGRVMGLGGSLGDSAGASNNTLLVTDADTRWVMSGTFYAGDYGKSNSLIVANGAIISGGELSIGYYGGSENNSVWVGGSGTRWTNITGLYMGTSGGSSNRLTITDGGRVAVAGNATVGYSGSNNIAVVNGTNSIWTVGTVGGGQSADVGHRGSGNLLVLTNGGSLFSLGFGGIVGYNGTASNNTAVVTGAGSVWSNRQYLIVGEAGSGNQLNIADGGSVIADTTYMGGYWNAGSNNGIAISGSGSLLTNSANIVIGTYGPGNRIVISDGGSVITGTGAYHGLTVGSSSTASNNSMLVTGTGSSLIAPQLTVGSLGGSNSLVIADNGLVRATNVVVGYSSGTNRLSVTGGSLYVTNAARNAALTVKGGTFQMNGGTSVVNRLVATNTSGLLDFKGGNLTLGGMTISNGAAFVIGDGVQSASVDLLGLYTNQVFNGMTLANNATLSGVGRINGSLTFQDGATFAPGHSPGTITNFGSVFFSDSSLLDYDLGLPGCVGGGTNDLLIVNGNLTLDGILNVNGLSGFGTGTYTLITYSGSLVNNGLEIGFLPYGDGSIQAGGGEVRLVVTPEPTTGALLALGVGGLAMRQRKRKIQ